MSAPAGPLAVARRSARIGPAVSDAPCGLPAARIFVDSD
ncbi:hypothetical protein BSIN_4479 [Burkholderia singularis]|uniref:Uncharacterized protein n=1 Tax=Burkholderia singularis TaxID=1503053 RepID=A0A238H9B3_9BURK|nr:hypothetical protein BSIN_4479 [Burkholderia singularis]